MSDEMIAIAMGVHVLDVLVRPVETGAIDRLHRIYVAFGALCHNHSS